MENEEEFKEIEESYIDEQIPEISDERLQLI